MILSFSEIEETGHNQLWDEKYQEFRFGNIKFETIAIRSPTYQVQVCDQRNMSWVSDAESQACVEGRQTTLKIVKIEFTRNGKGGDWINHTLLRSSQYT